jgi:predicted RNA-binding protein (virulence factor B family)
MSKIEIGRMNCLRVVREVEMGYFLSTPDDDSETILLPSRYVTEDLGEGDEINVFVYADSEDRLLATTETPKAMVGEMAYLQVVEINQTGAFLDWGLPKDLLLPYGEQKERLYEGDFCSVFVYKDKYAERIVASQRLNRHIGKVKALYEAGEKVRIDVVTQTDLGYKVVVNHRHWGLLSENEIFKPLRRGLQTDAWVKKVVEEDKVDLNLEPPRLERFSNASEQILSDLETEGGFIGLHDKSSPDLIRRRFGMSKKHFKAALGKLYRERKITIEADGIRLVVSKTS